MCARRAEGERGDARFLNECPRAAPPSPTPTNSSGSPASDLALGGAPTTCPLPAAFQSTSSKLLPAIGHCSPRAGGARRSASGRRQRQAHHGPPVPAWRHSSHSPGIAATELRGEDAVLEGVETLGKSSRVHHLGAPSWKFRSSSTMTRTRLRTSNIKKSLPMLEGAPCRPAALPPPSCR